MVLTPNDVYTEVPHVWQEARTSAAADFDLFYQEEFSRLAGTLHAMGGERSLAEEVAQDAFAHAWTRWSRVSAGPSPAGWVYTTAFRMLRRRMFLDRRRAQVPSQAPSALAGDLNQRVDLVSALRELPAAQQRVVVMRYLVDLSTAEVAERLGASEDSVRSTLHRARQHLRAILDDPPRGRKRA